MPCKLPSQVRTCLFICDSLLSPTNKSKRGNYLGRSILLIALKHNLLGHERKHRCSTTPVELCITTSWWRCQQWNRTNLEGVSRKAAHLLSRLRCWPCSGALRMGFHHAGASALALQRAEAPLCLHPVPLLIITPPCRAKERHWMYRGCVWGTCFSSPSKQEVQKKNSHRDISFMSSRCEIWIRRITIWAGLSF